ncbi:hypothetical protein C8R47DRAFT_397231 [Mycena vitilis]|nr:hypothetical protein C8R47DRAFT_397231 [Mycena vitilis]
MYGWQASRFGPSARLLLIVVGKTGVRDVIIDPLLFPWVKGVSPDDCLGSVSVASLDAERGIREPKDWVRLRCAVLSADPVDCAVFSVERLYFLGGTTAMSCRCGCFDWLDPTAVTSCCTSSFFGRLGSVGLGEGSEVRVFWIRDWEGIFGTGGGEMVFAMAATVPLIELCGRLKALDEMAVLSCAPGACPVVVFSNPLPGEPLGNRVHGLTRSELAAV